MLWHPNKQFRYATYFEGLAIRPILKLSLWVFYGIKKDTLNKKKRTFRKQMQYQILHNTEIINSRHAFAEYMKSYVDGY